MHEIKTVSYQEFWNRHEEVQKQNKQLSITCGIQTQILTKFLTVSNLKKTRKIWDWFPMLNKKLSVVKWVGKENSWLNSQATKGEWNLISNVK